MKNVFITGINGFLGGWLAKECLQKNYNVVGLVRDYNENTFLYSEKIHNKISLVRGDLTDRLCLERIINEYDIDTVFHLGAQPIVKYANRSPLSTFHSNIEGTWNLLEVCRNAPWVKKIIVASTDKAYGDQQKLPYTEDMPLQAKHPYDVSKSCSDLIAQSYAATYNMPIAITRCGNLFGGGDFYFNRIVPETIWSAFQNKKVMIRSDGLFTRDYVYVKDIADAYILLAQKMKNEKLRGEAFNISYGQPLTVIDLVEKILKIMGKEHLEYTILNQSSCEIKHQYLDSTKFKSVTGWSPFYTLDQGLKETVDWYQDYFSTTQSFGLSQFVDRSSVSNRVL